MENAKRKISLLSYYIILSSLTNLILIAALFVLNPLLSNKISSLGFQIFSVILLFRGLIIGIGAGCINKLGVNKDIIIKYIGIFSGRLWGVFIGILVYMDFLETPKWQRFITLIIAIMVFYFVGKWGGGKISFLLTAHLDRIFSIPIIHEERKIPGDRSIQRQKLFFFIFWGLFIPPLLVITGYLINYSQIPVGYYPKYLSISRIIAIVISTLSILTPWLIKDRGIMDIQKDVSSSEYTRYMIGLVYSIIPVISGFIFFLGMGLPILELGILAAVSCAAAGFWINSIYNK